MYYLFVTNLGTSKCVSKNGQDIYTPQMNIGCGPSLNYPSNIQKVRDNDVRCTGSGNSLTAEVYCDYMTAISLSIV